MPRLLVVSALVATVLLSFAGPASARVDVVRLKLSVPTNVGAGESMQVALELPASVAAVDGRVLFDTNQVELAGFFPKGAGVALPPQSMPDGAAFGAYNLKATRGKVVLYAVFVAKADGAMSIRVVIDAAADRTGRRIFVAQGNQTTAVRFGSGTMAWRAPRDAAAFRPIRNAGPVRDLAGDAAFSKLDMDVARAGWEQARGRLGACSAADTEADANGDGCVDVVDLQAISFAQGDASVPTPTLAPSAIAIAAEINFVVTSTFDTPDANPGDGLCRDSQGRCTLRAAVTEANRNRGPDRVTFNLAGTAPVAIQLGSNLLLQDRTGGLTIDGYSQPGSRVNTATHGSNAIPGVELRGTGSNPRGTAIRVTSANNVIRGIVFNNTERSIVLDGADAHHNVIAGVWAGYNASGTPHGYKGRYNFWVSNGAHDNQIGTPALADRNVSGTSTKGMSLYGPGTDNNLIQNNLFCVTPGGMSTATCDVGIDFTFGPKNNQIGGTGANERNVFGRSTQQCIEFAHGVNLTTSTTHQNNHNRIISNWLGFRADGSYDATFTCGQNTPGSSNDSNGINLADGSNYNLAEGNWIGSAWDGVNIMLSNQVGNIVRGNVIGESPLGQPAPLRRYGVNVRSNAKSHFIEGNTIRNAGVYGVALTQKNVIWIRISRNIITDMSGPAIYLAPDPNNSTQGANNLLPAPRITSATTIRASGTGIPGATVELYKASRPAGQSGLPIAFLASAVVSGDGTWSTPIVVAAGDRVTGLQINPANNTSALGTNVTATFEAAPPAPDAEFSWSQRAGTLTVDFTDASTNNPGQWSWSFGDGASSTERNPVKGYAQPGEYPVSLTVTGAGGSDSVSKQVIVVPLPSGQAIVADAFGRSQPTGWGSADVGGAYTVQGDAANYGVGNGAGTMSFGSTNVSRSALLNGVSQRDVDLKFRVSVDKAAAGGNYFVYAVARRTSNNEYRPRVIFNADGTVSVGASVLVGGSETRLGSPVVVSGLTQAPGQYIWVRAQVSGADPTTINVKAWADGQAEPVSWPFSVTDSQPVVQVAGAVGLRAYVAGAVTTAPVIFSFDDYAVSVPE